MDRIVVWFAQLSYRRRIAATAAFIAPALAALVALLCMETGIARNTVAFAALLYLIFINSLFFLYDARRSRE